MASENLNQNKIYFSTFNFYYGFLAIDSQLKKADLEFCHFRRIHILNVRLRKNPNSLRQGKRRTSFCGFAGRVLCVRAQARARIRTFCRWIAAAAWLAESIGHHEWEGSARLAAKVHTFLAPHQPGASCQAELDGGCHRNRDLRLRHR